MATSLSSILHQLNIESLAEICTYDAKFIAERFDEEQLNTLNNALRNYLWQAELLPAKIKDLNQCHLPIEVLGLAPNVQANLAKDGIQTVSEFIQRDTTNHLTTQWPTSDRLAVRTRIFCLLTLSTKQLDHLKQSNIGNTSVISIDTIQVPETVEEQIKIGHKFRGTATATSEVTVFPDNGDELEDCPFLHKPWFRDWLPDDFSPTYPEIVKILFEDVYQLPIATSRRHEIWAGAQMKAAEHLQKIISDEVTPQHIFAEVYKQLNISWQHLENLCIDHQLLLPNYVLWISEILTVRRDFYNTPRSRFRHFIKTLERSNCDEKIKNQAINVAFDLFEILWMFPDSTLKFMREHGQDLNNTYPSLEELEEWFENNKDLARDLETLQEQGLIARNKLVNGYFRSVLRFARNYIQKEEDMDYLDLVQEGAIGLIMAATKYDYRNSGRFIIYATSWIWQTTQRAISEHVRNIRVPVHRYEQFKQLEKAYQECTVDSLELPKADILCLYLDFLNDEEIDKIRRYLNNDFPLTPKIQEQWDKATKKTQQLLDYIEPTLSLSVEIPSKLVENNFIEDGETPLSLFEIIYDQQNQLNDKSIVTEGLNEFISDLCADLPVRTQQVINLRFGLEDGEERTLEEIGQQMGLTRERIRQLEKKALEHFGKRGSARKRQLEEYLISLEVTEPPYWPSEIIDYIRESYSYWSRFESFELPAEQDWQWLDSLIESLPGLGWHYQDISRRTQLEDALKALKSSAHYSNITEQLNDTLINEELDEGQIYRLLSSYEDTFILLGEGVFSLNEWEQQRSLEPEPVLPFCPLPLPDLPGQIDTFLESVLIAQEYLKQGPKTSDFLKYMLKWVRSAVSSSKWLKQSILNAYYLIGLIPYTFHFQGNDPVLTSTLPLLELSELRRYCLQKLTARLMAMPQFWWIIRQYQPGTISNFAEHFGEVHPLEFDDVGNRLKLLTGLGATQRLPYGRYQLTSFGTSLTREWARQPDFSQLETEADEEFQAEEDFSILNLGLW